MTCIESDDKTSIMDEICEIEKQIADLEEKLSDICMQRKLLNHRLADLKWNLSHPKEPV